jgi:hypothetical protein
MLTRVSCEVCGFLCLWTDDPKGFLRASCRSPARCEARSRMQIDAERTGSIERRARNTHDGVRVRPH